MLQRPSLDIRHGISRVDTGLDIHYVEVPGPGLPVLLLHGIGMDWKVWQAMLRRLAPVFHVFALDLRGHGESSKPAHGYTLAHYASDVEDLLDVLGLVEVALIGSSLGGAVAVAVEAPRDVVSHRILVDPPLTGGPVPDSDMFRSIQTLKALDGNELQTFLATRNPGAGQHLTAAMAAMWKRASDGVIDDMLADTERYYDLDNQLLEVESPTLLLQADPAFGAVLSDAHMHRALRLLRNGTGIRVPGSGHAIHAYKPLEFVSLVDRFIRNSAV